MTRNEHQNVHFLRSLGNKNEQVRFCFSRSLKNKKIVIGIIAAIFILIFGFLFLFLGPLRCLSQPFIERIINETPEAKIAGYFEAVRENDERKALEFWQLPDWEGWEKRSKSAPLLSNRRENVTEELIAMDIKDFDIFDIEWWGTCCIPSTTSSSSQAGGARISVQIKNQNEVIYTYIFDIFHRETSYWGNALGCPLRHWVIRDVYSSDQEPLFWKPSSTKEEKASEIIFPEVIWDKYVNDELGFSIDVPDEMYRSRKCAPDNLIPVKVFEDNDNNVVYINGEYYYNEDCEKIFYSLNSIKEMIELDRISFDSWDYLIGAPKPSSGWAIVIEVVKNDEELDKFIKENYGSECSAEDKNFWEANYQQSGVYDISVGGESDNRGTTLGTTSCVGAWTTVFKVLYFPEKNKVMSVKLGQEPTFQTNPHTPPYQSYDQKMINSFRFETSDEKSQPTREQLPHFEDYPVKEIFQGVPAPVDFDSVPNVTVISPGAAVHFETKLIKDAKQGSNFAGHYTVIQWGCGTGCQNHMLVDATTGKAYSLPEPPDPPYNLITGRGVSFRLNSRLLIADPLCDIYQSCDEAMVNHAVTWIPVKFYLMENDGLRLIYVLKCEYNKQLCSELCNLENYCSSKFY